MSVSEITTQIYKVGPYTFRSVLPRVGTKEDPTKWVATVNGTDIAARFDSLEAAMAAAIKRAQP